MSIHLLSTELQKKADDERNNVANHTNEDIKHLKEWLASHPNFSSSRTDDRLLIGIARGCKFSLQRTKEKLTRFYAIRSEIPEFFENRDPLLPEIQEMLRVGAFLPLPQTNSPADSRIIIARAETTDPERHRFVTLVKVCFMITEILIMEDDNFVTAGQILIMDMKGITMNHLLQATLGACKNVFKCVQQCYPMRPRHICAINSPSFVYSIYNFIKDLATEKIRNRVSFLKESEDLFNIIPLAAIPEEYGGDYVSLKELAGYWKEKVESYRDWFLQEESWSSSKSKQLGNIKAEEDILFGAQGSFRQLNLD